MISKEWLVIADHRIRLHDINSYRRLPSPSPVLELALNGTTVHVTANDAATIDAWIQLLDNYFLT